MTCPQCQGEHEAPLLRCTCGYDAVASAQWSFVLRTHLRNRKIALGSFPAGVVVLLATLGSPAMMLGVVAILAGPALAWVAHSYVREARKHLRGASTSKRLPTARIV